MEETLAVVEKIVILSIVLVVLSIPLAFFFNINTTKGSHTGYVTAVDQEGIFFRNYRVYFKTDTSSSQEDEYCVNRNNQKLAEQLKEVASQKRLVTIDYKGFIGFAIAPCSRAEVKVVK